MPSNTPNLGLYKKDPIADGNDTFNIETMLNENWDKIDTASKENADSLIAHLAETVQKTDKTINVPSDYSTVQDALDSLKYTWIPSDVTVTIQIDEGTYTHESPIIVNHPCGNQVHIVGATPKTKAITGVGEVSGNAGAYSVEIIVDSDGINVGEYVIIKDTTSVNKDDYDHVAHMGIWEITAVGDGQITVTNTHRQSEFPTATVNGGTAVVLKTILKFNSCNGVIVADNNALGLLDSVALIGDGSSDGSSNRGLSVGRAHDDQNMLSPAYVMLGSNFGVNGFGIGISVGYGGNINASSGIASSGNSSYGYYSGYSSSIRAGDSITSGNGLSGYIAQRSASIYAGSCTSSGNGGYGYFVSYSSSISVAYSVSSGNCSCGYYSEYNSSIFASESTSGGNSSSGYHATMGASICAASSTSSDNDGDGYHASTSASISAGSSESSGNSGYGYYANIGASISASRSTSSGNGNGVDYCAYRGGTIYCGYCEGGTEFSPAANEQGNYNSMIVID